MTVKVCDMIMGAGKTSAAINQMKEDKDSKYIYITPFLDEVDRIKTICAEKDFRDPKNVGNGKLDNLHNLLRARHNIVSTHALFRTYNSTTVQLIRDGGYRLILDEVADVVEIIKISNDDLNILVSNKMIFVGDDGRVKWEMEAYDGRFSELRDTILTGNVVFYNNCFMLWTFPIGIFEAFKDVLILTYLFDAQKQKYYFDVNGVKIHKIGTECRNGRYMFSDVGIDPDYVKDLKNKIHIIDDKKLNRVGDPFTALSSSWFSRERVTSQSGKVKQLKNNIYNVFTHRFKSLATQNIWTTFKDYQAVLSGKGYTKGFLPCNARATNKYRGRNCLAYCVNIFYNPVEKNYFASQGVEVKEDEYALSEMLQWIWRSAIRDGNDIQIYIPSSRMRNLLKDWMDSLCSLE